MTGQGTEWSRYLKVSNVSNRMNGSSGYNIAATERNEALEYVNIITRCGKR